MRAAGRPARDNQSFGGRRALSAPTPQPEALYQCGKVNLLAKSNLSRALGPAACTLASPEPGARVPAARSPAAQASASVTPLERP